MCAGMRERGCLQYFIHSVLLQQYLFVFSASLPVSVPPPFTVLISPLHNLCISLKVTDPDLRW